MSKVTIIGTTSWGNVLGGLLASKGIAVELWARTEAEARELNREDYNSKFLQAGSHRSFTSNMDEAMAGTDLVIWAVPSRSLRENVRQTRDYLIASMILMSAAKGLEADTGKRMSEIVAEEISPELRGQVCILSGPNLAREVGQGLPAASVIAARNRGVAKRARELIESPNFCIFISNDVVGVELCGALKNIIALGAGMVDGLALGDNTKAAFIALGWAEAISLGLALGAKNATFYGIAGLGDLMATCASPLSRNHSVGFELAKGRSLNEITSSASQATEGIAAAAAAHQLAQKVRVKTPIMNLIYQVLFEALAPSEAFEQIKGLKFKRVS